MVRDLYLACVNGIRTLYPQGPRQFAPLGTQALPGMPNDPAARHAEIANFHEGRPTLNVCWEHWSRLGTLSARCMQTYSPKLVSNAGPPPPSLLVPSGARQANC